MHKRERETIRFIADLPFHNERGGGGGRVSKDRLGQSNCRAETWSAPVEILSRKLVTMSESQREVYERNSLFVVGVEMLRRRKVSLKHGAQHFEAGRNEKSSSRVTSPNARRRDSSTSVLSSCDTNIRKGEVEVGLISARNSRAKFLSHRTCPTIPHVRLPSSFP